MKILLVDDHPLFLEGLSSLMQVQDLQVVGTARDGLEALEKTRALKPEVILMDIQMPRLNGLEATRLIKMEWPEIKIVILTMSEDDEDLFEAIKSGACGYLLKTEATDKFFGLLSGLMKGEVPLSAGLAGRILNEFALQSKTDKTVDPVVGSTEESPSPRQLEVLNLVVQGLTYKEVGAKLFISERTVKYHMGEMIERLHLKNRRQAIEYARRTGLVKK